MISVEVDKSEKEVLGIAKVVIICESDDVIRFLRLWSVDLIGRGSDLGGLEICC